MNKVKLDSPKICLYCHTVSNKQMEGINVHRWSVFNKVRNHSREKLLNINKRTQVMCGLKVNVSVKVIAILIILGLLQDSINWLYVHQLQYSIRYSRGGGFRQQNKRTPAKPRRQNDVIWTFFNVFTSYQRPYDVVLVRLFVLRIIVATLQLNILNFWVSTFFSVVPAACLLRHFQLHHHRWHVLHFVQYVATG